KDNYGLEMRPGNWLRSDKVLPIDFAYFDYPSDPDKPVQVITVEILSPLTAGDVVSVFGAPNKIAVVHINDYDCGYVSALEYRTLGVVVNVRTCQHTLTPNMPVWMISFAQHFDFEQCTTVRSRSGWFGFVQDARYTKQRCQ